jgi:hypothetical protein
MLPSMPVRGKGRPRKDQSLLPILKVGALERCDGSGSGGGGMDGGG